MSGQLRRKLLRQMLGCGVQAMRITGRCAQQGLAIPSVGLGLILLCWAWLSQGGDVD